MSKVPTGKVLMRAIPERDAPMSGAPKSTGLFAEFYSIVAQIPPGKVATYGQIARMAGHPRAARMVGWALASCPVELGLPCHRVVNREGRTAPGWEEQRLLLEAEGVRFKTDGFVDIGAHLW